jgi:hypothetical protein
VIFNAKLHEKYFLEIFQKDIESSIETVNKFSLIFLMEKGEKSGLIYFFHPPILLQTNTTYTIGIINGIHKKEVVTLLVFELFLVEVTEVSADFTLVNIVLTQIRCFPTLLH